MRPSILVAAAVLVAVPVHAEVVATAANGFVVRQPADVTASPDAVWAELIKPDEWWSDKHTFSGDAANLSIEPQAGGCFCEMLPASASPRAAPRGSLEHMRVIYAEQPRVLRMSGALGPLQSEAIQGTLTIAIKTVDGGSRIMWEYVVGGYMRQKPEEMAPMVDAVLGEQLSSLAKKLGPKEPPPAPAQPAAQPERSIEGR